MEQDRPADGGEGESRDAGNCGREKNGANDNWLESALTGEAEADRGGNKEYRPLNLTPPGTPVECRARRKRRSSGAFRFKLRFDLHRSGPHFGTRSEGRGLSSPVGAENSGHRGCGTRSLPAGDYISAQR